MCELFITQINGYEYSELRDILFHAVILRNMILQKDRNVNKMFMIFLALTEKRFRRNALLRRIEFKILFS